MTTLLVAGYRGFDLGIFQDKDERVAIIKQKIKKDLLNYYDDGLEWLLFTGNLGFEYWVLEVANELKKVYPIKLGVIFCFQDFGTNWNESNQAKLAVFKDLDFVKYCYETYTNPSQLKAYHTFLLDHVDQVYLFYDESLKTVLEGLYRAVLTTSLPLNQLTYDSLNDFISDLDDF